MACDLHYGSGDRFTKTLRHGAVAALCLILTIMITAAPAKAESRCTLDPVGNYEQLGAILSDDLEIVVPGGAGSIWHSTRNLFTNPINKHVSDHFIDHRKWMMDKIWLEAVLPALQSMTEQLTATAMFQMGILGTFFDAKHQLETNRLFQTLSAQAQKDYTPSEAVCAIGTSIRSLASTARTGEPTAAALSRYILSRQSQNANSSGTDGWRVDHEARMERFFRVYCDPKDNKNELQDLCTGASDANRRNKDVDFPRTLGAPDTLDIDFANGALSADAEDLLALSSYLYAHDVFEPITLKQLLNYDHPNGLLKGSMYRYMEQRSIAAQRSVAIQPFLALSAMKTKSADDPGASVFLRVLLQDTGIPNAEALEIIGANPSYYAQMGVMTKTLFQRPEFYVGLYDRPANLERKKAALQALSVMQKRDLFESALRSEAIISLWLELELMSEQNLVQTEINRLKPTIR